MISRIQQTVKEASKIAVWYKICIVTWRGPVENALGGQVKKSMTVSLDKQYMLNFVYHLVLALLLFLASSERE